MIDNPYKAPREPGTAPNLAGKVALWASFFVLSIVGCSFIFSFWAGRNEGLLGVARSAVFIMIMAGVHFVAYRAWQREQRK